MALPFIRLDLQSEQVFAQLNKVGEAWEAASEAYFRTSDNSFEEFLAGEHLKAIRALYWLISDELRDYGFLFRLKAKD